ncbi:hypothetical protein, partial [Azospirillum sp. OGB3]|uniref:hypothetical protein n=1 Tax=Azospirillum sp. OGB3 TaxID=2587012 RepID=UPI001B3B6175
MLDQADQCSSPIGFGLLPLPTGQIALICHSTLRISGLPSRLGGGSQVQQWCGVTGITARS